MRALGQAQSRSQVRERADPRGRPPASPRGHAGAAPADYMPARSSSVDSAAVGGRQPPIADRLRKLRQTAPPSLRPASASSATSIHKAEWPRCRPRLNLTAASAPSSAPTPVSRPPALLLSPAPGPAPCPCRLTAVKFRSFPPPLGPGAAHPWLRRGRRRPTTAARVPVTGPLP
jgi:hypothetical protein